jgi:hypothetical protein
MSEHRSGAPSAWPNAAEERSSVRHPIGVLPKGAR